MVMQRLSGLLGNIPMLGGGRAAAAPPPGYPSMVHIGMGDTGYNTAALVIARLPANGFKARIWEMTVPGGAWRYRFGSGNPAFNQNQGYWWFVMADADVGFCKGIATLAYESYDRHLYIPIEEKYDVSLNSGVAAPLTIATGKLQDKNLMQALPEGGSLGNLAFVQQYSRLVIDYKAIARSTAEDIADFNIPVTIYS